MEGFQKGVGIEEAPVIQRLGAHEVAVVATFVTTCSLRSAALSMDSWRIRAPLKNVVGSAVPRKVVVGGRPGRRTMCRRSPWPFRAWARCLGQNRASGGEEGKRR